MNKQPVRIEYMCTWCGTKTGPRSATLGRPAPGTCPRRGKTSSGQTKPHVWVINRKI